MERRVPEIAEKKFSHSHEKILGFCRVSKRFFGGLCPFAHTESKSREIFDDSLKVPVCAGAGSGSSLLSSIGPLARSARRLASQTRGGLKL